MKVLKKYNENGLTWDVIISLCWSTQLCIHPTLCFNPLFQSLISTSYIMLGRVRLYFPFWELILHPIQAHNNMISSLKYLLVVLPKPSQMDGNFMVNSPSKPFLVHLSKFLDLFFRFSFFPTFGHLNFVLFYILSFI